MGGSVAVMLSNERNASFIEYLGNDSVRGTMLIRMRSKRNKKMGIALQQQLHTGHVRPLQLERIDP